MTRIGKRKNIFQFLKQLLKLTKPISYLTAIDNNNDNIKIHQKKYVEEVQITVIKQNQYKNTTSLSIIKIKF